jgi:hypothetical protein
MVVALETPVRPSTPSSKQSRRETVLRLYGAVVETDRIAKLTGLSRRRVNGLVREHSIESVRTAEVQELRLGLFVDLEEVKNLLQRSLLFRKDVPAKERTQLVNGIVRIVHEQALLMGAHAPRQVAVTQTVVENPLADQYVEDLEKWMDLADKLGLSGYGSGREEMASEDAEGVLDADLEPAPPTPLRSYQAGDLDLVAEPRPKRTARRERVGSRRSLDDDDDDDDD